MAHSLRPLKKKPKLAWTEIKKSIASATPEYFYYPSKWLDDYQGGIIFPLIDREGTIDPTFKVTIERNRDLSLLTMYLPVNQLDYSETFKKFWNKAINLPHISVDRKDIFITVLATLQCYVFIAINDKGDLSSVKTILNLPLLI